MLLKFEMKGMSYAFILGTLLSVQLVLIEKNTLLLKMDMNSFFFSDYQSITYTTKLFF